MSVFSECRILPAHWIVEEERPLSVHELAQILYVERVPSQYGYSAKFTVVINAEGDIRTYYIPLLMDAENFIILNTIQAKEYLTVVRLRKGYYEPDDEDAERLYRINVKF